MANVCPVFLFASVLLISCAEPVSQVGGDTLGTDTTSWLGRIEADETFAQNRSNPRRTDIELRYERPKVGVQGKGSERVPRWMGVESIQPVENCRWAILRIRMM